MDRDDMKRRLQELIEPLLEELGFELVLLEYVGGRSGRLHLVIDREGGVAIEHCETASRAVSDMLDLQDPIGHSYQLEVSSPGLERPLTKAAHFKRVVGEKISAKTVEAVRGRKKFTGALVEAGEDSITVRLEDGTEIRLPLALVSGARLRYSGPR